MRTRINRNGTIETAYDDATIERTRTEPTPQNAGNPAYSKAIIKTVEKMREGSIANNNKRSCKIVAALRSERERKHPAKKVSPRSKRVQKMLGDF